MNSNNSIRNVAIIAHVDHGKTTLVDSMLQQCGTFQAHQALTERVMDNLDLEKERGITISAKNCSMLYQSTRINIVDTPGHADFGGEVERSLQMVDGAILLVDAAEGCLPQTRFVLQKALQRGLKMIVVVNKVDRQDARIDSVVEEIHDLFCELSTLTEHLDFPTLYASGRQGWCSKDQQKPTTDLEDLFRAILEHVPAPVVSSTEEPLQMLVSNLLYNPYVGRLAVGRVERGTISPNQNVVLLGKDGLSQTSKVISLKAYRGLEQTDLPAVGAGDIAIVALGLDNITIGDTIASAEQPEVLSRIEVDPPTVSVEISVNTSPLNGKEGNYLTSRKLAEFLNKQALNNVSLKIEETNTAEVYVLKARGELQIAIVMENLRREGGECMLGRPKIINREENGKVLEPVERVVIDTPDQFIGIITDKLSLRKGRMVNLQSFGQGRSRIDFDVPSRGLLGYRNTFLTDTKGEGLMSSYVAKYEPIKVDWVSRKNGAIVADRPGISTQYALSNLESRGKLFIQEGETVYEGMVVGENNREANLDCNVIREKKLTNMRAAGTDDSTKLSPITKPSLEVALEWIDDDEWIEVTPKNIRIRKRVLDCTRRVVMRRDRDKGE